MNSEIRIYLYDLNYIAAWHNNCCIATSRVIGDWLCTPLSEMTMKTHIKVLALATLTTVSLASHASPQDRAFDACVKAFISNNSAVSQRTFTVRRANDFLSTMERVEQHTFQLTATGVSSGKKYAQTTCTVDKEGAVTFAR